MPKSYGPLCPQMSGYPSIELTAAAEEDMETTEYEEEEEMFEAHKPCHTDADSFRKCIIEEQ